MTDFYDTIQQANNAIIDVIGEDITLPGGDMVKGIFEIPTEEGRLKKLALDYSLPVVTLLDEVAATLNRDDTVTIRSVAYTVAKKLPDGAGMTAVLLSDGQTVQASDWL